MLEEFQAVVAKPLHTTQRYRLFHSALLATLWDMASTVHPFSRLIKQYFSLGNKFFVLTRKGGSLLLS